MIGFESIHQGQVAGRGAEGARASGRSVHDSAAYRRLRQFCVYSTQDVTEPVHEGWFPVKTLPCRTGLQSMCIDDSPVQSVRAKSRIPDCRNSPVALVYLAAASIAYCEGMQSIGGISGKYNASALRCTTLESSGSVPNARDAACVLAQTSARVRDTSAQQACQKTGRLRWDACDPLTCQCLQWTARCQRATQKGYFRRSYQFSTRPSGHIDGHWIRHATSDA